MIELQGKYNTAKVFTDRVEPEAIAQIISLLNQRFIQGSQIRIMPDTHAGSGCTVGTTLTIDDKVAPSLVGVDIGCGMETVLLKDRHMELQKLDKIIHQHIPAGFAVREFPHVYAGDVDLTKLRCANHVNLHRAELSIGTLGGGNHFIELGRDEDGRLYLVVHSGSRNLGKQVAEYYHGAAVKDLEQRRNEGSKRIAELRAKGWEAEAEAQLQKQEWFKVNQNLAYLQGELFDDYLHDMALTQQYAALNRRAIVRDIVKQMKCKVEDSFTTVHNYIDLETRILRKGAISAKAGEQVILPINMRDGSLLCIGRGNPDWNFSAPHGAGRLMSRSAAKNSITLSQFKASMEGIYSSTVSRATLDESPFAYKPMEEILQHIGDTVEVQKTIKPIYNFKAGQ